MRFTLAELLTHDDPKEYLSAWISGVVGVTKETDLKNRRLMLPFNELSNALCNPDSLSLESNPLIDLLLLYTDLLQLRSSRLQSLGLEDCDSCDILGELHSLINLNQRIFAAYFLKFSNQNNCPLSKYASYDPDTQEISCQPRVHRQALRTSRLDDKEPNPIISQIPGPHLRINDPNINPTDLLTELTSETKLSDENLYFFIINKHKHTLLKYIFENERIKFKVMKALFKLDEHRNPSQLYRFLSIKVRHSIANNGSPLVTDHYTASLKKLVAQAHHFPSLMLEIILQNKLEQLYLLKDSAIKEAILNHIFQQDSETKKRMIKIALTPDTPLHNYMAIPQSRSQNIPLALPYKVNTHSLDELCKKTVLSNPSIILNRLDALQNRHKDWRKHLLLTCGQSLFDNWSKMLSSKDPLSTILEHLTEFQQDRNISRLLAQFLSLQPRSRLPSGYNLFQPAANPAANSAVDNLSNSI